MMKINSVSCRQFAGLRNLKPVDFEDGLNIIYGPNESGKSTLVGLIYSLLWQNCKIDGRKDKEYKNLYFPAEVRSGARGNTIDGKLVVEGEDGTYTISKKWATAGASGDLETPEALLDESADANAYAEAMKKLLKYGEGVYREAIFANQKTIDSVLQALLGGKLKSDLSAVASSAMLDMGGISSEKFLAAIDQKLKDLEDSWDFRTNGPKDGRGIDHKIGRNVGLILKAYYQLEESKKKLRELKAMTEAVGTADKAYGSALEEYHLAERNLAEFNQFYMLLVNYQKTEGLKTAAEKELQRRRDAQKNWPKHIRDLEKAKMLEAELNRAEAISLWKQLEDILSKDQAAEASLQSLRVIDADDVTNAKKLAKAIQSLENRLKNFNALITFTLSNGYELVVSSEVDGHRIEIADGKIELSEAVRIEIPGVAEFHMSAADLDVEHAAAELQAKKKALSAVLEKYGADTIDDLMQLQENMARRKCDLERDRKEYAADLRRVLGGKEQSAIKAAYESAACMTTREKAVIESEIKALAHEPIGTFISLTERSIKRYEEEFETESENGGQIEALETRIISYEEDLSLAAQIPEEFRKIKDPEGRKKLLEDGVAAAGYEKDDAYRKLVDARAAIKAAEETDDYMQPDELAEVVADNEVLLTQRKEEYAAWTQIKAAAEGILNATGTNPLQTFEDDFRRYLSFLSEDGVMLDSLGKKLEADIYSGNNRMTFELLSEGTKDTISLAFRLAVIKFLYPDGGGLAIFDDPFTDMDAERRARACSLLKEFAKDNQVIFTTCSREYLDLLGGNIIELDD